MLKASRHTSSSPSTNKSSPDDISSDVFQETAIIDIQARKQLASSKRWLTGKSDNMTPNCLVPVESCNSDLDDHSAEEAATELQMQTALMSQAQTSISSPKVGTHDMDVVFDDSSQQDTSSPDSIPTSFYDSFHKIEESNNRTNIAYHGSDLGGTGIKIRTHQAQNQ